jgi:hypothetical protein
MGTDHVISKREHQVLADAARCATEHDRTCGSCKVTPFTRVSRLDCDLVLRGNPHRGFSWGGASHTIACHGDTARRPTAS